jgi:hypothetical protein
VSEIGRVDIIRGVAFKPYDDWLYMLMKQRFSYHVLPLRFSYLERCYSSALDEWRLLQWPVNKTAFSGGACYIPDISAQSSCEIKYRISFCCHSKKITHTHTHTHMLVCSPKMMNAVLMLAMLAGAAARPVTLQQPALQELKLHVMQEQTKHDLLGQERKLLHNHAPSGGDVKLTEKKANSDNTYVNHQEANGSNNDIDKPKTVAPVGHTLVASGDGGGNNVMTGDVTTGAVTFGADIQAMGDVTL